MPQDAADPDLSYAAYFDHPVQRAVVRAVEHVSGQPKIKRLYDQYRRELAHDTPFWDAAMRLLELDVQFSASHLAQIPKQGPLVVVANHPFGVLDGLTICWIVSLVRPDFKILTNAVLMEAPEVRDYLLPIDFAETKEAQTTNIVTRKESMDILKTGGCIIVFPAGGVSTAPSPFRAAIDDVWKPFTAKLITGSGANVTPIYFEGQNSRLFQWVSPISMSLRLALIFREVKRRMGKTMNVHIGETLTPEALANAGKRAELMAFLRNSTYSLAPEKWQRRIAKAETSAARKAEKTS
ncbi:MAG: lysophospholipid acyltransferase family protein [Pseudomonadota bacterium]